MVCPRCGQATPDSSGRCAACLAIFAGTTLATGVVNEPVDPSPAGMFPSTGLNTFGAADGTAAATSGVPGTADLAASGAAASGPLKVGQSFGSRYHIIKLLGAGGMGAVYQAWDAELSVAVALKVIRVDRRRGSASPDAEKRFKNELLLARQVTHKHVVRIHDLGEIDGIKYITMPYVQGDDLGTVLRREGKLPIARALRLARQMAERARSRPRRRRRPPRLETAEHHDRRRGGRRAGAHHGLRHLVVDRRRHGGHHRRHARIHVARAGHRRRRSTRAPTIYAFGLILYEMLAGLRADTPATGAGTRRRDEKAVRRGLPAAAHGRRDDSRAGRVAGHAMSRARSGRAIPDDRRAHGRARRLDDAGRADSGSASADAPDAGRGAACSWRRMLGTTWYLARGPPTLPVGASAGVGADCRLRQPRERPVVQRRARERARRRP